jgi:hypothetical protein
MANSFACKFENFQMVLGKANKLEEEKEMFL